MTRRILCVVAVAVLSAAVGAQSPRSLSPGQKAELFKTNRELIEKIVGKTVESSKSPNEPLNRANTYYDLLRLFSDQIVAAARVNDGARVEELTVHLSTLLDRGLAPTLGKAKSVVEGGTGVQEFVKLRTDLILQLNALQGSLGSNPTARASLDGARARLDGIVIPEKK